MSTEFAWWLGGGREDERIGREDKRRGRKDERRRETGYNGAILLQVGDTLGNGWYWMELDDEYGTLDRIGANS